MKKIIASLSLALFVFPYVAMANPIPPPSMEFSFSNLPEGIKIIGGQQIECRDDKCNESKNLSYMSGGLGDFGEFKCDDISCRSTAFFYLDYHKIIVEFSDKMRESEIFYAVDGDHDFKVLINSKDSLTVSTKNRFEKFMEDFLLKTFFIAIALIFTMIIETLVAFVYFFNKKIPNIFLKFIILANLISMPIFWIAIFYFDTPLSGYIIGEIIIFLFEAVFLSLFVRQLKWYETIFLSISMNMISLVIITPLFYTLEFVVSWIVKNF